jgi:CheY-like chemotaxis protein
MESANTSALVLCSDQESSAVLDQALAQFKITPQTCLTGWAVQKVLKEKDFDILVLDFDEAEAGAALDAWSSRGPNSSKVVIAFARNSQAMKQEHRRYAHFYLQKPLTQWLLVKTLKVACGVVLKKRRATFRCTINLKSQISVALPGSVKPNQHTVTMVDVSNGGSCVRSDANLTRGSVVTLSFRLPETEDLIQATGKVVWSERNGLTGIQFTTVPNKQQHQLGAWLDERDPNAIKVTVVDNPNEVREGQARQSLRY